MDEDTLELVERRLAERIEARVRGRLFAYYAAVGGVLFAVLGFFGYNIVTGLKDTARDFAEGAVAPSVEAADSAAAAARDKAAEAAARLEAFAEFQKRREDALFESEKQAELNQSRIDRIGDEIEGQLGEIGARLQDTRAQVEALGARANEAAGVGSFAELAGNLAGLSGQVRDGLPCVRAPLGRQAAATRDGSPSVPGMANPPGPHLRPEPGSPRPCRSGRRRL